MELLDAAMTYSPHPRNRRSRYVVVILIAAVGIGLSNVAFFYLRTNHQDLIQAAIQAETGQRIRAVENRFGNHFRAIYQLSSFVSESVPGTRADFETVAQQVMERNPAWKRVMWVPRIRPDRRSMHEEKTRLQGPPGYGIRIRDAEGNLIAAPPRAEHDDHFPLQFLWPVDEQHPLLGVDLKTVPEYGALLQEVLDENQVVVTPPWRPQDEGDSEPVFLVVRAILQDVSPSNTLQTVADRLVGFFVVAIGVDALFSSALDSYPPGFHAQMYDVSPSGGWDFVCAYDTETRQTRLEPIAARSNGRSAGLISMAALEVPGRTWMFEYLPSESFLRERLSELPMVTLVFGLMLTGLLTIYANTLLGQ